MDRHLVRKHSNNNCYEGDASSENDESENSSDVKKNLSDELDKLNNLLKEGVLTQEEFEKAKKKLLDN